MVGEPTIELVVRTLRSIAKGMRDDGSQDIRMMPDVTPTTTFRRTWQDGEATIVAGSDLMIEATPIDGLTIEHPIGAVKATGFTLIEERRMADGTYRDARTVRRRIADAAEILERALRQDPKRLSRHESSAAATVATLGAAMTAFVPGERNGSVFLPGPYGAFTFDCPDAGGDGFDGSDLGRIVWASASLAPRSIRMSATMRGNDIEIRLGPTAERVLRTDPIETMRILAAIETMDSRRIEDDGFSHRVS